MDDDAVRILPIAPATSPMSSGSQTRAIEDRVKFSIYPAAAKKWKLVFLFISEARNSEAFNNFDPAIVPREISPTSTYQEGYDSSSARVLIDAGKRRDESDHDNSCNCHLNFHPRKEPDSKSGCDLAEEEPASNGTRKPADLTDVRGKEGAD